MPQRRMPGGQSAAGVMGPRRRMPGDSGMFDGNDALSDDLPQVSDQPSRANLPPVTPAVAGQMPQPPGAPMMPGASPMAGQQPPGLATLGGNQSIFDLLRRAGRFGG